MEIVEKEIEARRIKTLERLTVNWFEQTAEVINVVIWNGEYYCIDDPILLKDKDKEKEGKVKVRVVAEVNSEKELYKEYLRNIMRAPLNPYALFLFYKKGYITGIPKEYLSLIEDNKDLPIAIIERLNEQLMHFKLITTIDPAVLNAINSLLKEAEEYGYTEKLLEEILSFVEVWVEANNYAYPDAETLYSTIMALMLEDYKKNKRKKEEEEELKEKGKEEEFEDINIDILDQKQILPIPAIASASTTAVPMPIDSTTAATTTPTTGTTTTTTNVVDNADSNYNNNSSSSPSRIEKKQEVNMVERTIAFKITYPVYKEEFVNRLINKFINSISRVFRRAGLTIQTT